MKTRFPLTASIAAFTLSCAASIAFAAAEPSVKSTPPKPKADATAVAAEDKIVTLKPKQKLPKTVKQLYIIDTAPGPKNAETATPDSAVLVNYTGWLYDATKPDGKGVKFDSSEGRQTPFGFFIGAGKVIKGWDRGVVGMRIGGKRTLIIPPALAYGDSERPRIPANSTLIFEVELFNIVGQRDKSPQSAAAAAPPAPVAAPVVLNVPAKDPLPQAPTQITAIDQAVGEGPAAAAGNEVLVHYTGWLYDPAKPEGKGNKFDSSRDRDQLFRFKLGGARVIKGWDFGVVGMKVKGKRTLIIPAEFGYGARGAGNGLIPPGATLIFDVELVELPQPPAAPAEPAAAPVTK